MKMKMKMKTKDQIGLIQQYTPANFAEQESMEAKALVSRAGS